MILGGQQALCLLAVPDSIGCLQHLQPLLEVGDNSVCSTALLTCWCPLGLNSQTLLRLACAELTDGMVICLQHFQLHGDMQSAQQELSYQSACTAVTKVAEIADA